MYSVQTKRFSSVEVTGRRGEGSGQTKPESVTGWLGETFGSYAGGLWFAAAMMGVGTVLLVLLKIVDRRDAQAAAGVA